ncbi:Hypothetical predicted protein, partial [Paramuricea clavata]
SSSVGSTLFNKSLTLGDVHECPNFSNFSKAFDSVSHRNLLLKLEQHGVAQRVIWVSCFHLTDVDARRLLNLSLVRSHLSFGCEFRAPQDITTPKRLTTDSYNFQHMLISPKHPKANGEAEAAKPGEHVRIRPEPRSKLWRQANVVDHHSSPRSYIVETGQQKLKRNRVALRLDPGRSAVEVAKNDYAINDDMSHQETLDNPNPVSVPPAHHPTVATATSTVKDKETPVQRRVFTLNDIKDHLLLKEIAAEGVLQHKSKSRERGACWLVVANNLGNNFPNVEVTSRAVRDRYRMLERRHKSKMAEEERATGISGEELTEGNALLEELTEMNEETERRVEENNIQKKATVEKERGQALEMRKRAMERIGETRKRQLHGNDDNEKKRRKSGETFEWLREKAELDKIMKEEELKKRREERVSQREERMMFVQQMQLMQENNNTQVSQIMQQQDYQQQQQQQQQFSMMQQQMLAVIQQQQQQQQTQVLVNLFKNNQSND